MVTLDGASTARGARGLLQAHGTIFDSRADTGPPGPRWQGESTPHV
jgi:hypothetical protein